jgi:hypothetical protein
VLSGPVGLSDRQQFQEQEKLVDLVHSHKCCFLSNGAEVRDGEAVIAESQICDATITFTLAEPGRGTGAPRTSLMWVDRTFCFLSENRRRDAPTSGPNVCGFLCACQCVAIIMTEDISSPGYPSKKESPWTRQCRWSVLPFGPMSEGTLNGVGDSSGQK